MTSVKGKDDFYQMLQVRFAPKSNPPIIQANRAVFLISK